MLGHSDLDDYVVTPLEQMQRVAAARARLFPPRPVKPRVKALPAPEPEQSVSPLGLPPVIPLNYWELLRLASPMRVASKSGPEVIPPVRAPTLKLITLAVCQFYEITPELLKSERKHLPLVRQRQACMWLMRKLIPEISTIRIARHLGGRDHSTVIHGTQKIAALIDADDPIKADIDALTDIIIVLVTKPEGMKQ